MSSMKTKSYPSGHSVQGTLIAKVLGDKYPKTKSAFVKTGENISYSRRVARAHYKSDSKMGEQLGNSMYKHIKNKI
jgi:membrane-associated phospholipid phosphatase